jgi:hypothetical protein
MIITSDDAFVLLFMQASQLPIESMSHTVKLHTLNL